MVKLLRFSLVLLWFQLAWVSGQKKVEQIPQSLSLQEGENVTIKCNYSFTENSLQWFRQDPQEGIVSLFVLTIGVKKKGRFGASITSKERHSFLHITNSKPEDSGTYLCAVEAQWAPGTCKLCIKPPVRVLAIRPITG
uniref:Ig-like domain-containing protein n=1 Tax=Vombatus ursinus TaxID=29139 RepID=A0A4X2LRH9_VOMUR